MSLDIKYGKTATELKLQSVVFLVKIFTNFFKTGPILMLLCYCASWPKFGSKLWMPRSILHKYNLEQANIQIYLAQS